MDLEAGDDEGKAVDTADETLREALDPLNVDNPRYVVQFFDAREDDAERLRDLMVEAGADTERATRAAEWYFRQVDREINVPESGRQGGAAMAGAPDPDEVAERTAREVERRIKTDETADERGDDTPEAVAEARDKAVLTAAERVEKTGEKIERLTNAALDLLIEAAREDPELKKSLIEAVGAKTLVQLAAERDNNLLEKLTIESDDGSAGTPTGGPGAARMAVGGGSDDPDPLTERTRKARERAEESDAEAPPPVTAATDGTDGGDGGDDGADGEEVLDDFGEVA